MIWEGEKFRDIAIEIILPPPLEFLLRCEDLGTEGRLLLAFRLVRVLLYLKCLRNSRFARLVSPSKPMRYHPDLVIFTLIDDVLPIHWP
jgi:hypothetical protein